MRVGARAAPKAVDGDDVRAGAGHARGDGGHVVHRRHLDDHRLFVAGSLLEGMDQLVQVLDGIDVVVGRRGDGVRPLGDHAGAGNVAHDLVARQVSADAGLGALAHLDLDGGARVEVIRVHAEAAGGHLHDGVGAVAV